MRFLLFCLIPLFASPLMDDLQRDINQTREEISHCKALTEVQHYLYTAPRNYLNWMSKDFMDGYSTILGDYEKRARTMNFFDGEMIKVDDSANAYNQRAILSYSTFNRPFDLISRHYASLQDQKVRASYLIQWGGFPDIENGSLSYIHLPYAFKHAFLKEALRKGYRYLLWIDGKHEVLNDLEEIFECIEEKGYFFPNWEDTHVLAVINRITLEYYGITDNEFISLPHYHSTIMGFDMEHPKVKEVILKWLEETEQSGISYLSSRPEQNSIGLHLYKAGLLPTHSAFKRDVEWKYIQPLTPLSTP